MIAETALAAALVEHLRVQNWDLFFEVDVDGPRCDIVATRPDSQLVLAVEVKTAMSWQLLKQALRWRDEANWVVIATPKQKYQDRDVAQAVLRELRLGWTVVELRDDAPARITELLPAPLLRSEPGELRHHLRAEHQHWAPPGNATGARYTAFSGTKRAVEEYVRAHPLCEVAELLAAVPNHYKGDPKTARRVLLRRVKQGLFAPVKVKLGRFYLDEDEPEAKSA